MSDSAFPEEAHVSGFSATADRFSEAPLDLNELLVRKPAATFFVRAAGEAMTGAGILPGDILVVDRSLPARSGAIVVAWVDGEFLVRTYRDEGGEVRLEPANPALSPVRLSDGEELRLFGVVTACVHRFAKVRPDSASVDDR